MYRTPFDTHEKSLNLCAVSYTHLSENLPVLYTLDGHGEKDLDASIREDIEKANIEIRSLKMCIRDSDCSNFHSNERFRHRNRPDQRRRCNECDFQDLPVSYTHLDVYKRQSQMISFNSSTKVWRLRISFLPYCIIC